MPCLPRLGCTVTRTNLPDDAECTQASFPATRNPVSSKCATSAAASAPVMASSAGAMSPAILPVIAASAPGDGAQPNISASAAQARSRDRNWPCHRYAPSAAARGPYCTGAVTPSGARPLVRAPQPRHSRSIIWCSVTSAFTGGISVTCRRSIPGLPRARPGPAAAPAAAGRLVPDHVIGMISQLHRRARLALRPAGLPAGLLPQRPRRRPGQPVLTTAACEEFLEFCPTRAARSATCACSPLPLGLRYQRPQPRDLRIPLGQQFPQPRIRRTQPSLITGHSKRIGHTPQVPIADRQ